MVLKNLEKQKVTKVLVITFLIIVLLFVNGCNFNVTRENYNKIHTGMSFNEVVEILGNNYEVSSDAGYGGYTAQCYIWEGLGGANITIIFLNGKVYSKGQAGL